MSIKLNRIVRCTFSPCSCLIHRRFYADKKTSVSHYDALGVRSNASTKEIKTAYYKLSKKHHPDMNPHDSNAAKTFSTIANAYDTLGDPIKRREYDNEQLAQTAASDPYVTYDRTSAYAQRARAHRPSAWKPSASSSENSSGGFQGAENAFGSSRSTNYGSFDKENYDASFGRYRGPLPKGRSNIYDFDEFYRAHYGTLRDRNFSTKQAQDAARQEQKKENDRRNAKAARGHASRLSFVALWLSVGLVVIFSSSFLHEMHFQQPTNEPRSRFVIVSKPPSSKS